MLCLSQKYGRKIEYMDQPLLVAVPKKRKYQCLQGNLFAFGTGDGNVLLLDVSVTRLLNLKQSNFARLGALVWNENVLSSGTSDSSILHHGVRSHSHVTERTLLRHRRELSRNELQYY
jgi:hypothetical protein